jgi:alkanesulfonate monooxygenase SsuD/methylene tetrahydromethanopterin reductase-like flavin-dependent oxidoreductase (luciferase family)
VRIGVVILPEDRWDDARSTWRRAEELGFDHAWCYDHLAWRSLRDSSWFSAVPTLAAAASATSNIRLGTLVASPNFRHPVPFARELITLDDLSRGRITAGLGAGGQGWDATILGHEPWTPAERAGRFAEFVALLDRLLREREVSSEGRYYRAKAAPTHPGCIQQPRLPFAIAATGRRGMCLAAEHGELWVTNGDRSHEGPPLPAAAGAEIVGRQMGELDEICRERGRDPATLGRLVLTGLSLASGLGSPADFEETQGRYAEVGVTDLVVHWPRASEPYAGNLARFEQIFG